MTETKVIHFKGKEVDDSDRLAPSTCTEAETFVLQVRDDSMEPEFKEGCIILIDPTGHATDGSYVLAEHKEAANEDSSENPEEVLERFIFRQLRRSEDGAWVLCALNDSYPSESTATDLSKVVGVIVQRAGTRRRYHKRYD